MAGVAGGSRIAKLAGGGAIAARAEPLAGCRNAHRRPVGRRTRASVVGVSAMNEISTPTHRLLAGDANAVLDEMRSDSVDLIITSPPYADARKNSYSGVPAHEYVEWFLPISEQLLRVLKPSGTFILNIKEGCRGGERQTYVLELILALRAQGWIWTEEFIWHKKHCYPGKWPNRFRDAWERVLQFNKSRGFAMYQDTVRVPPKGSTILRGRHLTSTDHLQVVSGSGSGLSRRMASCVRLASPDEHGTAGIIERSLVYPDNVLYLPVETRNRGHSAAFPEALPDWFIRLFTRPGDVVLDPFMGSGTTNAVAKRLGRHSIGIDLHASYVAAAQARVDAVRESAGACTRTQRQNP